MRSHLLVVLLALTTLIACSGRFKLGAQPDDEDTPEVSTLADATTTDASQPETPSDTLTPSDLDVQDSSTAQDVTTQDVTARDTSTPQDTAPQDTNPVDVFVPPSTPLADRLEVSTVTVAEAVASGVSVWRIWGQGSLEVAPVFTVPMANCGTLVGYSANAGGKSARVAKLDANDALVELFALDAGHELRGLAAEPDGHFAALLWEQSSGRIWVKRYSFDGVEVWATELLNADNHPDDFNIGDSRLTYGGGRYGAYYHTHSDSGHEGDTLKWVTTAGAESTGWSWGCSHSMSVVLSYSDADSKFMPACVTDCFPGTPGSANFTTDSQGGIYVNHTAGHVMDLDGGCNGSVAGELGSAAPMPSGWSLSFNGHQAPMTLGQASYNFSTMNQDIGLAAVSASYSSGAVVWLTDTPNVDEADSSVARWEPEGGSGVELLVGWTEQGSAYKLARVSAAGAFLEGPIDVTATAKWGRRDDPFRQHSNGDVLWSWFDGAGSTTLRVARVRSGSSATCAGF